MLKITKENFKISAKSLNDWLKQNVPTCYGFSADNISIIFEFDVEPTEEIEDLILNHVSSLTKEGEEAKIAAEMLVSNEIPDVTPRQIRQALIMANVSLQEIEDALNSLPEPTKSLAKVEWEYSISFQRNRPLVSQVAAMLGWTEQQLDDLWITASHL